MKNRNNLSSTFLWMFIVFFAFFPVKESYGIIINNIDYVRPQNVSMGFGGNIWHDNFIKGTAIFPLAKVWEAEGIGVTGSQPVIIDDLVFTLAGGKVIALDKTNGKLLDEYKTSWDAINGHSNIFVIKSSNNRYIILSISGDGKILSLAAEASRIKEGSIDKLQHVNISRIWEWNISNLESYKDINTYLITSDVTILKDKNLDRIYIGFGTYSGELVILDLETGVLLMNGAVDVQGKMGSSSGITYKDFATIALPVNSENGGMIGGTVVNGIFHLDPTLPEEIHTEGLIGPTAYAVVTNPVYNTLSGMLIMQDNKGTIIAYDTTRNELLFKIDKYEGTRTINGFSIAGRYILAAISEDDSTGGLLLAIDFERAIQLAQARPDLKGNGAIIFEEALGAENYNGAIALQVAEEKTDDYGNILEMIKREVFITGRRGTGKNLQMYYLDQYNASQKKPILVPYGFRQSGQPGVYTTSGEIEVPGGITTPLSYAGGYLVFGDGKGNVHAYTAVKENNLALTNLDASEGKISKGNTYVVQVDVINYTGDLQRNIPMEFYIDGNLVHNSLIEIPEDGLTVNFQFTVPNNYQNEGLEIQSRLNMREPRSLNETTYDDNILALNLEVEKSLIDLEARELTNNSSVAANIPQTANVKIVNHSDEALENVLVWYRVAGRNVKTERINLAPRAEIVRTFQWTTPNHTTNVTLSVVVDPNREVPDINRSNNTATRIVVVNKSQTSGNIHCNNNGHITGDFFMSYTWLDDIIEHSYTDIHGNTTNWYEEIWESRNVNYTETMISTLEINTNQQHTNSRGGWEIIPYAERERLAANKITRSGYGIELKVNVSYSTSPSWESLPSSKATAYGLGYLNRLNNVRVFANLPNGQRVEMVRTSQSTNNVTFELPEISYTPTGLTETWKGRFFSMPARTPDGTYPINIEILGGGQNNLNCNVRDEIYIYGDVYRDTYIRRSN